MPGLLTTPFSILQEKVLYGSCLSQIWPQPNEHHSSGAPQQQFPFHQDNIPASPRSWETGTQSLLQTLWPAAGRLCLQGLPRSSLHSRAADSALRLPSQGMLTDRETEQGSGLYSWLACSPRRSLLQTQSELDKAFSTFPFNSDLSANKMLQQFVAFWSATAIRSTSSEQHPWREILYRMKAWDPR